MRRTERQRGESGAVLVLALVFLVAVGLVLAALVSFAGTNLMATSNLQSQRDRETAADAAVDGAIQALKTSTSATCLTAPGQEVSVGTVTMWAQCASYTPLGATGRIAEFDACSSPLGSFAACQAAAVVRAEVTYVDTPTTGSGMDVWSWVVDPASS